MDEETRVLDHYYLRLRDGSLAVATGNYHYATHIVGYIKYVLSKLETLWRGPFGSYERVVKQYTTRQVYSSTATRIFAPVYGAAVPTVAISEVERIYNPIEKTWKLYSYAKDELERTALEAIHEITRSTGVKGIGITGSLLVGIHNPEVSDIDLVIYGTRESRNVLEFINENPSLFRELPDDKLKSWCIRVSESTGLSPMEARKHYRRWRRGVFRGREFSLIYNDGIYRSMENSENWTTVGVIEASVTLKGGLEALNYPSLGVIESFKHLRGVHPTSEPQYVLSFEALYIPALYEGGHCLVKGLLQIDREERYRVLVGVNETDSFIIRLV